MYFKRLNNKYVKKLNDHVIQPQPASVTTINDITLSKNEQVDLLAVRSYGPGNEGSFYKIGYKNADRLLAWDLDNTNISKISIPESGSY